MSPLRDVREIASMTGASGMLWEPSWKIATRLLPLERELLRLPALRRLHFIAHGGVAAITTPYVHTRLQHVLGVFSLAAHLLPDSAEIRAAALLHDVGHAPFSHSLEAIPGVDHHVWNARIITSGPVADVLHKYGLEPERVLALAEGTEPSVLKNRLGVLHLDHLDSFVRSGRMRGTLPVAPRGILQQLERDDVFITVDAEIGALLEQLILEEAQLHGETLDLGAAALLSVLVGRLVDAGALKVAELPRMIDAEVTALLFAHESTRIEARRLWFESWRLKLERLAANEYPLAGAWLAARERLYLDLPRVRNRSEAEAAVRNAELVSQAEASLGRYAVSWQGD